MTGRQYYDLMFDTVVESNRSLYIHNFEFRIEVYKGIEYKVLKENLANARYEIEDESYIKIDKLAEKNNDLQKNIKQQNEIHEDIMHSKMDLLNIENTKSELEQERQVLQNEINTLNYGNYETVEEIEQAFELMNKLEQEMSIADELIQEAQQQIETYQDEIEHMNQEIDSLQNQFDVKYEELSRETTVFASDLITTINNVLNKNF